MEHATPPARGPTTDAAGTEEWRGRPHILSPARPRQPEVDGEIRYADLGPMDLELGGYLLDVTLAYRTWGELNPAGDNAIFVLHALTGDTRAAGDGGWWEPLIGPGRTLDTDRAFVVCANVLGGCGGSTGPASVDLTTGLPYAARFPFVTIGDSVAAQRRLAARLGITRLVAIGGSIGGVQALEWATRYPELVAATVAIAVSGRLGTQGIALHSEVGRRFIDGLQLFSHLANVGDAKSLAIHPAATTHYQLTTAEQHTTGVTPDYVRLSVGFESAFDLISDLSQALEAA